ARFPAPATERPFSFNSPQELAAGRSQRGEKSGKNTAQGGDGGEKEGALVDVNGIGARQICREPDKPANRGPSQRGTEAATQKCQQEALGQLFANNSPTAIAKRRAHSKLLAPCGCTGNE